MFCACRTHAALLQLAVVMDSAEACLLHDHDEDELNSIIVAVQELSDADRALKRGR